jgi:DNA modification methylase
MTQTLRDKLTTRDRPWDIVLDPFLGNGSTLMAAERTGRICCGIEIDPLYVDVAIRRWQRLTGDRAIHAESCVDFAALELEETGARHDR